MTTTETLLQQAISAARAGQRDAARTLLMQLIEVDERNEQAWLWLAGVVDDPEDMRTCLENARDLNPQNAKAIQGLAWIDATYGPRPQPAPVPVPVEPQIGPTTKLVGSSTTAPAAPSPTPAPQEIAAPTPTLEPDYPCPYCGEPTMLVQRSCRQCHNSLMIRGAPREKRSLSTTILSGLYWLNGMPSIGAALFIIVSALIELANPLKRNYMGGMLAGASIMIVVVIALLVAIPGAINWLMAWGLFMRKRWAYIITAVTFILGLLATLSIFALLFATGISDLTEGMKQTAPTMRQGFSVSLSTIQIIIIMTIIGGFALIRGILIMLSYYDFFSQKVRFAPEVSGTDSTAHYNNGVEYKNRGMWYMATKEWEAAVKLAPRDLHYLHALGLAYAQIKEFAKARTTLDQALTIAPGDGRIQESRALVDQMATRTR